MYICLKLHKVANHTLILGIYLTVFTAAIRGFSDCHFKKLALLRNICRLFDVSVSEAIDKGVQHGRNYCI